jgi:hypothetical protein
MSADRRVTGRVMKPPVLTGRTGEARARPVESHRPRSPVNVYFDDVPRADNDVSGGHRAVRPGYRRLFVCQMNRSQRRQER